MTQVLQAAADRINIRSFALQFGIVFLLILTLPLDRYYYRQISAIHLGNIHFQDLFQFANYIPFLGHAGRWGLQSFAGWGWALGLALVLSLIWSYYDKKFLGNEAYWYYGLRVVLRYRLAAALLSYGFILIFAVQAPYPALSDLHTKYGFFLPWRIYYDSLAVSSAGYVPTLGLIEVLGGIFLLFRRTSLIGAGIAAFLLINIVLANFAYELGDHVISVYLLLIALVLIAYDAPRLYQLLFKEKTTQPDKFDPVFSGKWPKTRLILKGGFVIFFFIYASLLLKSSYRGKWPFPDTPGLQGAEGFYDVRHFSSNGIDRPYSLTDSLRWEDVVFEKWNTLSVNVNRQVPVNYTRPAVTYQATALLRTYEGLGNGDRLFYTYEIHGNHLSLVNKNDPADTYELDITRPSAGQILLEGSDHSGNRLQIQLNKINKKYLLYLGRRHPVKVY
ncbi:MAG: hypothetical protein J0H74_09485 [Chitinophagaceae bacterium]|nr:hypothetical protein [Chitinophagaceae bacterium]